MNQHVPIYEDVGESAESARLVALFDELEGKQLDFLDEAGKRIVELIVALVGVLFALAAFGEQFPPAYLAGNAWAKVLTLLALGFFMAGLVTGMIAVHPRDYNRYDHNVTEMRHVLRQIVTHKSRWVTAAGVLLGLGAATLAVLLTTIVLRA